MVLLYKKTKKKINPTFDCQTLKNKKRSHSIFIVHNKSQRKIDILIFIDHFVTLRKTTSTIILLVLESPFYSP